MKKSAKSKEGASKKSSTSKSRKASGSIVIATEQVYQVALKSIISSLVQHCPREILIEISKYINTIFPKLKDLCLNSIMENDTVKRRELVWKNVTSKILDVLHPDHQYRTEASFRTPNSFSDYICSGRKGKQ